MSGEPIAIHTDDSPIMKVASCRTEVERGAIRRMRSQPRAYTHATSAIESVVGTSIMEWAGCTMGAILRPQGNRSGAACAERHLPGGVLRRLLPGGMECFEERHERRGLGGTQVLSICRHVAAALDHLPDELVFRQSDGDGVEPWTALPTFAIERVAVVALLHLEHERSLPLERRAPAQVRGRNRLAAPRVHRGTPRRIRGETGQRSERDHYEQNRDRRDRAPLPALLAFTGNERQREQEPDRYRRPDQQRRGLHPRWQQRQHGVEPEEEEVRTWRGLDDRRIGLPARAERTVNRSARRD